ncbi:thiol reductant ABC exporter subunit CydC [Oenococcus sp.]|uniref:thiol reductant ABC exporter subunit CydC n=1 Tax=Oenococcus sp. TaxID=1979414 RepID=UPI0039E94BB8
MRQRISKTMRLLKQDHWFIQYLKKDRLRLGLLLLIALMTIFCAMALMFTSGFLISKSARHPYNLFVVYVPVVLTRAFGIGRPVFKYFERLESHDWVLRIVSKLRADLYSRLERQGSFLSRHFQTGRLLGLFADDLDHLENFYLRTIFPISIAYLLFFLLAAVMAVVDWRWAILVVCLMLIVLLLLPVVALSLAWEKDQHEKSLTKKQYQDSAEALFGLTDWQISGHRADFLQTVGQGNQQLSRIKNSNDQHQNNMRLLSELFFALAALTLLFWSSQHLTNSQNTANFAASVILTFFPLMDTFVPVVKAAADLPLYFSSLNSLNQLSRQTMRPAAATQSNKSHFDKICFQNVSFTYGDEKNPLLDHFSLTINRGEKIAILGPSGEGKTTLLQLLIGDLQADQGEISFDEVPVDQLQQKRAANFAYLNQAPFIFNSTILNNVRLGNEQADDQQVIKALNQAGLTDLIQQLPAGIETQVGESGHLLSGGQRQRIALARILLKDAPILLLDEPTLGLDPVTEHSLMQTIFRNQKDKTMFWITHHLAGLEKVDRIIFLEKGKAAMSGSPRSLYETEPRFKKLYDLDLGRI